MSFCRSFRIPHSAFPILTAAALLLAGVLGSDRSHGADESLRRVAAVVHVHSTWSSGDQSLEQLVARAKPLGIEAIFLTENFLQRFEYGLPPLRGVLRHRIEYPSLAQRGLDGFLREVQALNARQRDVVLVPGVELIPHYYWTGGLWRGTLTMHDGQKNLLALGMPRSEDYRRLPVVGNEAASTWGLDTLWLLSPALLVVPGLWLLTIKRPRIIELKHFRVTEERRLLAPGLVCLAVAAVLLANNYPFRRSVSPYDPRAGLRPHQAAMDFVTAHGGVVGWSLPEARDRQVARVGPFRATIRTDPYPDDLLRTDRFAIFGGVYEDTTTFTQAGGGWDALLLAYLAGHRAAPAWAVGEAAYHREGHAGKRLGEVQTILLSGRKEPAALLEAMRAGRMYALRRTREESLVLCQFRLLLPGRPAAEAGSHVSVAPSDRPEIHADITTQSGRPMPVQVRLVRSGQVVQRLRGVTPLALRQREGAGGGAGYYRVEVEGPAGHQLLSNPIIVTAAGEARG